MACRLTELALDAHDPDGLADFWCRVLGYEVLERSDEGVQIGAPGAGPGGPQPTLYLSRTTEPKGEKLRLHLDLCATDRSQEAELDRLLSLGARPADVGQRGDEPWHVLADPEGNEFCLLRSCAPDTSPADPG